MAEHLFVFCPIATSLINWFYSLLFSYDPHACFPRVREMLCGYPRTAQVPKGFSALLAIIRHHIWVIRNASRFDGVDPVLALSMERIKSSFRFLLLSQQHNCLDTCFECNWLVAGQFGTVRVDGSISFNLALEPARVPPVDD